ncbi:carbamoyl-phosphate synthase large subunit [Roseovarius sp. TM1035]|nr:carbamoyl-phosphate synthase large subunit [Roseovarius sp. TM1035]
MSQFCGHRRPWLRFKSGKRWIKAFSGGSASLQKGGGGLISVWCSVAPVQVGQVLMDVKESAKGALDRVFLKDAAELPETS